MFSNSRGFLYFPYCRGSTRTPPIRVKVTNALSWRWEMLLSCVRKEPTVRLTRNIACYSCILCSGGNVFVTSHTETMRPRQVRKHRSRGWVCRHFNTHAPRLQRLTFACIRGSVRSVFSDLSKFEIHRSSTGPFDMQPLGHTLWVWRKWSPAVKKQFSFLLDNNILSDFDQSGFINGRSSSTRCPGCSKWCKIIMIIIMTWNNSIGALDRKQHCVAMLVDLYQAFDSVDHKLLLIKLRRAGFGPQTVDQTQRAYAEELNLTSSREIKVSPWDYILEPFFFLVFFVIYSHAPSASARASKECFSHYKPLCWASVLF